ncbi:hypothetical protein NXS19_007415 [Fusarium pseudograminearum]|nr:hypothetical protein NXS19_007415 [Fusarium pseudograminearum]
MLVERKVKVVTEQNVIDKPPVDQFPMREWSLKVFMVDEDGNERPADVFTKVVYNLHPTFENPVQSYTKHPFTCKNEGWGEFEISIDCYTTEKTKLAPIIHDLNFHQTKYEQTHTVVFKNPPRVCRSACAKPAPSLPMTTIVLRRRESRPRRAPKNTTMRRSPNRWKNSRRRICSVSFRSSTRTRGQTPT